MGLLCSCSARIGADWVQIFARSWRPNGPTLVGLEVVYSATDPPIRAFRRLIPPLRLGAASIDLSILCVLVICYILRVRKRPNPPQRLAVVLADRALARPVAADKVA